MTDSILRSYQPYTFTSIVPFPAVFVAVGADYLLTNETDGFAIDATSVSASPSYVGAPYAGYISVKDTVTPANNLSNAPLDKANLTNSGTSMKMVQWGSSSPYLRWTPHNLSFQSQTFGSWSTLTQVAVAADAIAAPDGTTTADKVTPNATSAEHFVSLSNSALISGLIYTVSCYAKSAGYDFVGIGGNDGGTGDYQAKFNLSTGAFDSYRGGGVAEISNNIENAGGGWYRCSVTFQATGVGTNLQVKIGNTSANVNGNWSGDTTSGIYVWGFQLNRGPIVTPYRVTVGTAGIGIPQAYDAAALKFGIWSETAATNLVLRSQDFSATWVQTDTTRTSTTNAAPDTSSTATLMTEGVAGTAANSQAITITANATYTISVFLKLGNNNFMRLGLYETAATTNRVDSWFNLNTGVIGTPANGGTGTLAAGTITSIDGLWYRCTLTGKVGNGATAVTLDMSSASADGSATRVNAATYNVWGAQTELDVTASSYIPTVSATATRAKDNVDMLVSTVPYSTSAGTAYDDTRPLLFTSGLGGTLSFDSTSAANRWWFGAGTTQSFAQVVSASTQTVFDNNGTTALGTRAQITYAVAANDSDLSANGIAPTSDATVTMPVSVTKFGIGCQAGTTYGNAFFYRIVYVPYQRETINGDVETWRYNY